MTRWLGALNLGVAALGILFAVALARELADTRPLPRVPQAQTAPAVAAAPVRAGSVAPRADSSANLESSAYGIIASRNVFDPSRSAASATAGLPGERPLLYGVVAGTGVESRAYVADPVTKVVRGYLIGDTVGGWRLDQVREDRAVFTVTRPGGGVVTGSATTDGTGKATYRLRIQTQDPPGTYGVSVMVTLGNISGGATTSFQVK